MGTCCGRGYESQEIQLEFWKAILWNEQDEKDKFNRLEDGTQKDRHNDTHPKSPTGNWSSRSVTWDLGGAV